MRSLLQSKTWAGLVATTLSTALSLTLSSGTLCAQHPSELTVRDKTQIFVQHVVKFMKIEPQQYQAMVLEYEIGATLAEATAEHEHEDGCIHDQVTHLSSNFIENAMVEIHPSYAAARRLFDEGKDSEANAALEPLATQLDPYLAAHARLLQAEIAHRSSDADRTLAICEEIVSKHRARLIADHRACELIALTFATQKKTLLELAQYALLLTDYQEIPKEVDSRAKARMNELGREVGMPLNKVANWMNDVEKSLSREVTGEPTQTQEREIVTALDKLIELEEARERKACNGCGGSCKGGACQNGRQNSKKPQNPRTRSLLPNGGNKGALAGVSRANADSVWGQLRLQDASRAIQAFSGKLPSRYEKLLEQYYKDLSRED
jgi:hypothetical protein